MNGLALFAVLACLATGAFLLWDSFSHPLQASPASLLCAAVLLALGAFLSGYLVLTMRRLSRFR